MGAVRLLIVEDDLDIAELLKETLDPPFEVVLASDGMGGMQAALTAEPDLIISDIMMPVMDGYEFISRLRKEERFAATPVIFLSALGARDQIKKGYELGATLYLTKPIDPSRLLRNIELFIDDHGVVTRPKTHTIEAIRSGETAAEKPLPRPAPEPIAPPQPRRPEPRPRQRVVQADTVPGGSGALLPRVLVVEDDRAAADAMVSALDDQYEPLLARDGIEAIEAAVRYEPDVLIIDGKLPKMTGYQLVAMLRKNKSFCKTPLIFVSGKSSPRDRQYVEKLGVNKFLSKPFEISDLIETLVEITDTPEFIVKPKRMSHRQIELEKFRDFETHRAESPRVRH